ncbi:MAG: PEP-CTERM sorting domain-containing protein [Phycisphaerae bacterium]|jgi:hypothetical protein
MKKTIILATLCILIICGNSFAGRVWFYNEITPPQGSPFIPAGNTAIGMRSDNTWPVVGYAGPADGAAAMLPGVWMPTTFNFAGQYLDGATAPDGTVAFADNAGQVVMLGKTGWSSGSYNGSAMYRSSIAFNNNSAPAVLSRSVGTGELTLSMKSGSAWYGSTIQEYSGGPGFQSEAFAVGFDSYNQVNVAFRDGSMLRYATKGVLTGNQWVLNSPEDAPEIGGSGQIDMALTNNDVPYVLYSDMNFLKYSIYDRQSDSWTMGILDALTGGLPGGNFCVAADNNGGIGVAYVTQFAGQNMLSFAYNDGSGWMLPERLIQADINKMVGLAFDYENNPVISYVGMDGKMRIAYDPVEIPEPATMAILALGLAFIRRR